MRTNNPYNRPFHLDQLGPDPLIAPSPRYTAGELAVILLGQCCPACALKQGEALIPHYPDTPETEELIHLLTLARDVARRRQQQQEGGQGT